MEKMKRFIFLIVLLQLCGLFADVNAEVTVGAEIPEEAILEFFYTVDASYDPPLYQRYRLYTENGKKWLYHESRQGGGWPQTEEDIVFSGTVELTEENWSVFFDCLRDGTVREREEEIVDGDDGPWTFLYWSGDEGRIQEFRFASLEKRFRFEELCSGLAQNHVLTSFSFSRGGYIMPEFWEIFLREGRYYLREGDDEESTLLDGIYADEILRIIAEDGLESWNGFDESNPYVLDGEFFRLQLRFADGSSVYAYGDNAFPENYHDATDRLFDVLTRVKMSRMAGTYQYAGDKFSLEILLKADGTYTCSVESPGGLTGRGTWTVYADAIYLSQEDDSGLSYMFCCEKDALIYLAAGSDSFPSVTVPDEACFERVAAE